MSVHAYHEGLPGYSPDAVLHDGCEECEGRTDIQGLLSLDSNNFARLWKLMLDFEYGELPGERPPTNADAAAVRTLYYLSLHLQRNFDIDPRTVA